MTPQASNTIEVAPGMRASLLRYSPAKVGSLMSLYLSGRLIDDTIPAGAVDRALQAEIRYQGLGQRGGGTLTLDIGQGCSLSFAGCTVDVTVINGSDNDRGTYRVDGAVCEGSVGRQPAPVFSQRINVAAPDIVTAYMRVPEAARSVRAFGEPLLPAAAEIALYRSQFPLDAPIYRNLSDDDNPIVSGAEFARVENLDGANRAVVLVWTLGL